jgi:hypothetical protein
MKPYSIQAPEEIAKAYDGNKQKISAAAQSGIVDPTAAILAGMFIDRMRAAQSAEQASSRTVAQQVLGPPQQPQQPGGTPAGAPGGAPGGPPPGAGGPGGAPGGAPGMPPPGGPPPGMPPPGGMPPPPQHMAMGGGLEQLPIHESMAPDFADGGLVAFADGGGTNPNDAAQAWLDYIHQHESGGRGDYDKNGNPLKSSEGALYGWQVLPSTAHDPGYGVKPAQADNAAEYDRVGQQLALAMRNKYGDVGGAMAYNWGPGNYQKWLTGGRKGDVPNETRGYVGGLPGGKAWVGNVASGDTASTNGQPGLPDVDMDTRIGKRISLDDATTWAQGQENALPHSARDAMEAYIQGERDPAKIAAQKQKDIGYALMAAAPSLVTAGPLLGAAPAALAKFGATYGPEAAAREAAERKSYTDMYGIENAQNVNSREATKQATELYTGDAKLTEAAAQRQQEAQTAHDKMVADAANIKLEIAGRNKEAQIAAAAHPDEFTTLTNTALAGIREQNPAPGQPGHMSDAQMTSQAVTVALQNTQFYHPQSTSGAAAATVAQSLGGGSTAPVGTTNASGAPNTAAPTGPAPPMPLYPVAPAPQVAVAPAAPQAQPQSQPPLTQAQKDQMAKYGAHITGVQ